MRRDMIMKHNMRKTGVFRATVGEESRESCFAAHKMGRERGGGATRPPSRVPSTYGV